MLRSVIPPSWANHLSWIAQLRWGHGVVTKVAVIAVVGLIVVGVAIARVPSEWAIVTLALLGLAATIGIIVWILRWAEKNPELAATEGPTFVQTRRLQMAAKTLLPPPDDPAIADPQNPTLIEQAE